MTSQGEHQHGNNSLQEKKGLFYFYKQCTSFITLRSNKGNWSGKTEEEAVSKYDHHSEPTKNVGWHRPCTLSPMKRDLSPHSNNQNLKQSLQEPVKHD